MPGPLDGVELKLNRAIAHIEHLYGELQAFTSLKPYTVRLQPDTQDGVPVARLIAVRNTKVGSPDPSLVLLAGEILYQCRSALDHLVHQLVISAGNAHLLENSRRHQFPIFDTPEGYRARAGGMVRGITPLVDKAIEREQPYVRFAPTPHCDPLWTLQDLNNTDKHRLIPSTVVGIGLATLDDDRGRLGIIQSPDVVLKDNEVFMTLVNESGRYDHIRPNLTCTVAFQQAMEIGGATVGMDLVLRNILSRVHGLLNTLGPHV